MNLAKERFAPLADWPIILTKIQMPTLYSDMLARDELVSRVQQKISQGHCMITASAGYGKSTLACQLTARLGQSVVWLSLDAEDNQPARFSLYLSACLFSSGRFVAEPIQQFMQSGQMANLRQMVSHFLNESLQLNAPLYVFLDDMHCIHHPSVLESLDLLLSNASPYLRVVMLSRHAFALPSKSKLILNRRLHEFVEGDIAFNTAQSLDFLQAELGECNLDALMPLLDKIEGWPAGLQFLCLYLAEQSQPYQLQSLNAFSQTHLIAYLQSEVFHGLSDELQQLLINSSILRRFNRDLLRIVTPKLNIESCIHLLKNKHLFLVSLDASQSWFRYHHLFQQFLQHCFQGRCSPDYIAQQHAKCAYYWYQQGDFSEATWHALQSQDIDLLVTILLRDGEKFVIAGHGQLLEQALNLLPNTLIYQHFPIGLLAARYYLTRDRQAVLPLLAQIEKHWQTHDIEVLPVWRGALACLKAQVMFGQEQLDLGMQFAQEALSCLPEDADRFRSEALQAMAEVSMNRGDLRGAVVYWQQSGEYARKANIPQLVVWSEHQLAAIAMAQGDLTLGQVIQKRAAHYAQFHCVGSAYSVWCLLRGMAEGALEHFDLVAVAQYCQQAEQVVKFWFNDGLLPIYLIRARQALMQQEPRLLAEELAKIDAILYREHYHSYVTSQVNLLRMQYALFDKQSDVQQDAVYAQTIQVACDIQHREQRALALAYMGASRLDSAIEHLMALQQLATEQGYMMEAWRHQIWLAVALFRAQRLSEAYDYLQRILNFGASHRIVGSVLEANECIRPLLQHYAKACCVTDEKCAHYLKRLLDLLRPTRQPAIPQVASTALTLLNSKEQALLKRMARGETNEVIALEMHMALGTVKNSVTRIYRKLNLTSRQQAIAWAKQQGLLEE